VIVGLKPGDRVRFVHQGEETEGEYIGMADPDERIEIRTVGGTRRTDAARVMLDEGGVVLTVFSRLEVPR
jgi:hypothetical protein